MSKVLEHDVVAIGWGLIYTPLCAKKSLTLDEAAAIYTRDNPPGTSVNQWVANTSLDEDMVEIWNKTLPDEVKGQYPVQCPDSEAHHHFLVNC